jgi:colanic acid biosynthesis glycosyl transferase WcaI
MEEREPNSVLVDGPGIVPRRQPRALLAGQAMRVQLWSYNYAPEPTGIGPVSTVFAKAMQARGHEVEVVSAHPHYPQPVWGRRLMPYREVRDGIKVLRLPLWVGRATSRKRIRQEVSFMSALFAALPSTAPADLHVVVSPSFPALLPAIVNARARRTPWVLWLHDVLPDGAASTGLVESSAVLGVSRWLERAAYREAARIVVLSHPFLANLRTKGVPEHKLELIYDPATRRPPEQPVAQVDSDAPRILLMGNIGHTQGLTPLVRAFEGSDAVQKQGARLVITGDGVAAAEVRAELRSGRVEMLGVVSDDRLEQELRRATLALVTQLPHGEEFNLPSKVMNYMAYGIPVVAAVNPASETARIVNESGGGWVADSRRATQFPECVSMALTERAEIKRRAEAAFAYARTHFSIESFADRFERVLLEVGRGTGGNGGVESGHANGAAPRARMSSHMGS